MQNMHHLQIHHDHQVEYMEELLAALHILSYKIKQKFNHELIN